MSQNKRPKVRYSIRPSNPFLFQWIIIALLFNLALFVIMYFIINPLVLASNNPELYDRIAWGVFILITFLTFVSTYISINSIRYWIDIKHIEVISSFRPKKKRIIPFEEINSFTIRRIPYLGNWLHYGTIVLQHRDESGKKKVKVRLLGIKFPLEVIQDIAEEINVEMQDGIIQEYLR